jgi:hypothetical protein
MAKVHLPIFVIVFASGCGGSDDTCSVAAQTGCDDGQVCEDVSGGTPACFAPVELRGKVIALADGSGIAGARVVALDVNGAAVTNVAISGADGTYRLPVPTPRNADGSPAAPPTIELRADASGFQSFPGPVRQALPLDLAMATPLDDGYVLQSAQTDIGLIAESVVQPGSIAGKVAVPDDHVGILVVAELAGKGFATIAARDGSYAILNLAAGSYSVTAYAVGHVYGTAAIDVAAAEAHLDLALTADAAGSISGTVSIVDGGGASATSVVAFVESTFDTVTGRGTPPPGLRSPSAGAPNVTGAFTLDGAPPGKYVVVAAFENEGLVRDPDHCIAGTADVHVTVAAGQMAQTPATFKVTGALAVGSPGATAAEPITGTPTFAWADDSSEDQYLVELFDAFGQKVWMKTMPGVSGSAPSMAYDGPALASGMFYRWRATSSRNKTGQQCELSRTEDLRGVFFVP